MYDFPFRQGPAIDTTQTGPEREAKRVYYEKAEANLVPAAHVSFGQRQDTELLNNQFPDSKILGVPVSRRIHILVYMASRDKVDRNTFHKGIQYALEKLGKSNLALKEQQYKF